ncbi:MAG: hypothetical protein AB8B55_08175 [Mariniblastus sp.]
MAVSQQLFAGIMPILSNERVTTDYLFYFEGTPELEGADPYLHSSGDGLTSVG